MARILIVDDEAHVVSALRRLLKREGFAIEVAHNGEEALSKLPGFEPDLVISDFRMKGMNGAELLEHILREVPKAVRVLLSGYADLRNGSDPSLNGLITHFISKPWDDQNLINDVRALLEHREPQPRA